ncbi:MAG TPA: ATP-binding cassette domain-containing protein [Candidatus Acidoferrum sp.]|nr:ATP-binding cassette domain-containing protein [Candidatus Acidoferrum sp.]
MAAPQEAPVVQVEHVECRYGQRVILRDISFSVRPQEIFFLTGRSGCGKTTLLLHLLGLMTPARGRISYFGREFSGLPPDERRGFNRRFGVLFQSNALWTDMSLAENVSLPLVVHTRLPREVRDEIVALKLTQVGLAGSDARFPRELSGGMQKRAALARALALDPAILFFDEPTAGLDPITSNQIDDLILQVRDTVGATVLVVSHSLSSIFHIADRMILLDPEAKSIVAEGSPEELLHESRDDRVKAFLAPDGPGQGAHSREAAAESRRAA